MSLSQNSLLKTIKKTVATHGRSKSDLTKKP
jgi:hypothetical protein